MPRWVRVAASDEVDRRPRRVGGPRASAESAPDSHAALAALPRSLVLLRRTDGTAVAVLDGCPHLGTSLLAATVDGDELTCPAHVYSYDLCSGAHTTPGSPLAGRLELLPVREADDAVEVDLAAVPGDAAPGPGPGAPTHAARPGEPQRPGADEQDTDPPPPAGPSVRA